MHSSERKDYKLKCLGIPRYHKNLAVIDLDHTLCDRNPDPNRARGNGFILRPNADFFLTQVYKEYDIVIWSATRLITIKRKLQLLKILDHPRFKILCYAGTKAMIPIIKRGRVKYQTKDLKVIWKVFPQYHAGNTILVDDKRRNFKKNPDCGLLIEKFIAKNSKIIKDTELLHVLKYLMTIASQYKTFYNINHRKWRRRIQC